MPNTVTGSSSRVLNSKYPHPHPLLYPPSCYQRSSTKGYATSSGAKRRPIARELAPKPARAVADSTKFSS